MDTTSETKVEEEFASVFQGLGNLDEEYEINSSSNQMQNPMLSTTPGTSYFLATTSQARTKQDGVEWGYFQSGQANTVVCGNGRGPQEELSHSNLR